ncbi:hypothetical protein [Robiginitalea sp. SC105]|uniref:hypothetical protein n=1 Tax=Robiginitalea sp. SC105 TaxID=2762332 RepID=UPI001639DBD3|nr:hypothetical protein [Robiginitalea sp. SC105]MBC2840556.1 hypothetical protein [Robiginitalea sp. SC105]
MWTVRSSPTPEYQAAAPDEGDGNTYTVNVTSPLTGNFECTYLVSGVMIVGKNGLSMTVDFGDGSCDNEAILTYPNGMMETYEL